MQLEPYVLTYLKASLLYLILGAILGVLLALGVHLPGGGDWALVHAHLNLVGFVLQMIFGISYHTIPRFAGLGPRPFSPQLAIWQLWLVNIGLLLQVTGFATALTPVLASGGILLFSGIVLYVVNLWVTLRGAAGRRSA